MPDIKPEIHRETVISTMKQTTSIICEQLRMFATTTNMIPDLTPSQALQDAANAIEKSLDDLIVKINL